MQKNNQSSWKEQLREICKILKDNNVDIQKIPTRKTLSNGIRKPTALIDITIEGIDIKKIITKYGLSEDFPIGYYITQYRNAYNGTQGTLTQEEREDGEALGIVVKPNKNVSTPIFKGRKISQFHLDYINGMLDKILNGQINTKEALELLKQASINNNETVLNDSGSIKRCIKMLLKDRPEELKTYYEIVKKNSGRRNPNKGKIGKPKIGLYHEKEEQFRKSIIENYLPLIISGKITFDIIEQELSCSHHTINKIIEEFYLKNDDLEGLQEYQKSKKKNSGVSLEKRESAQIKRKEVANYNVVTNREFLLLSPEEQESQLVMKIRLEKLKEELSETSVRKSALISEDIVRDKINIIMNYFKNKNTPDSNEVYFSDTDIRYMIFRFPTLINRSEETLDEKINVLTSYNDIDDETAFGMIKTFPAIMGYEASRTKKQLDLLEKEGLIDSVISSPRRFMLSVNLMYALIQYAKERHHILDLSEINRNNIFLANSSLKRIYGVSHEEIKAKFPYIDEDEQDIECIISPVEIAKATYSSREKSVEASKILKQAMLNNEKGTK